MIQRWEWPWKKEGEVKLKTVFLPFWSLWTPSENNKTDHPHSPPFHTPIMYALLFLEFFCSKWLQIRRTIIKNLPFCAKSLPIPSGEMIRKKSLENPSESKSRVYHIHNLVLLILKTLFSNNVPKWRWWFIGSCQYAFVMWKAKGDVGACLLSFGMCLVTILQ